MNIIPALYDKLRLYTPKHMTWARMGDDAMLELTIQSPSHTNMRYVLLRITQHDNLIGLDLLCGWAGKLRDGAPFHPTTTHEEVDLLDPDFLDRIITSLREHINLSSYMIQNSSINDFKE